MQVETTTKVLGVKTNEMEKEQCVGQGAKRSILVSGRITTRVALEHMFGQKDKVKINYLEIDTLATGNLVLETDKEHFTIRMEVNMKENGKII